MRKRIEYVQAKQIILRNPTRGYQKRKNKYKHKGKVKRIEFNMSTSSQLNSKIQRKVMEKLFKVGMKDLLLQVLRGDQIGEVRQNLPLATSRKFKNIKERKTSDSFKRKRTSHLQRDKKQIVIRFLNGNLRWKKT